MKKARGVNAAIGQRIRVLRKQMLLTQEELAERAEMSHQYLAQVERGQRNASVASIQQIAAALGVSLEDIFRFPHNRPLAEIDEQLVSSLTLLLAKASPRSKKLALAILREIVASK